MSKNKEIRGGSILCNIFIHKEKDERYRVLGAARRGAFGAVEDAPTMSSYHERERQDYCASRCSGFGVRVAVDDKQVVPAGRGDVDGVAGDLALADYRHACK